MPPGLESVEADSNLIELVTEPGLRARSIRDAISLTRDEIPSVFSRVVGFASWTSGRYRGLILSR